LLLISLADPDDIPSPPAENRIHAVFDPQNVGQKKTRYSFIERSSEFDVYLKINP
jgi:hypothetical protein